MEGSHWHWSRDSDTYRTTVASVAFFVVFQCGNVVVRVAREDRHSRWSHTKQATIAQGCLAIVCGVMAVLGTWVARMRVLQDRNTRCPFSSRKPSD